MPAGRGAPCPPPPRSPASPASPGRRRGAARSSVPQKLAEALSSQYGLNVFVAGLLFLLGWAVHAAGVGKRDLLCLLTALMLLQLLWMLWYVGRSHAQRRRLLRPKDAHAGARWLRGECAAAASSCLGLPGALPGAPFALCFSPAARRSPPALSLPCSAFPAQGPAPAPQAPRPRPSALRIPCPEGFAAPPGAGHTGPLLPGRLRGRRLLPGRPPVSSLCRSRGGRCRVAAEKGTVSGGAGGPGIGTRRQGGQGGRALRRGP